MTNNVISFPNTALFSESFQKLAKRKKKKKHLWGRNVDEQLVLKMIILLSISDIICVTMSYLQSFSTPQNVVHTLRDSMKRMEM